MRSHALAFTFVILSFGAVAGAACGGLSQADREYVTTVAGAVAFCDVAGEMCKHAEEDDPDAKPGSMHCFAVYDACMRDAGLRGEGGK